MQEFYVNATKKCIKPLHKADARAVVATYSSWCIDITHAEVFTAFRIEDSFKISFWDALIVAAAVKAGATMIYSEDMNAGQEISGVRIVNPLVREI